MESKKTYHFTLFMMVAFLLTGFALKAQPGDAIIGDYLLPNGLVVKVYKTNYKYSGKIIALDDFANGQIYDIENPDKSKHKDLLIGKIIIWNLEYNKQKKRWVKGSMYGPDKGITVDLEILRVDKNTILIEGSKYFFSKEMEWKKIN